MSAIAGLFHLGTAKPVDPARVRAMIDVLAHRGPEGSGVWTAQGVGLGHRCLSIMNTGIGSGGAQPMVSPDERFAVTLDGEIYNIREVRRELEADGAQFRTGSDTEVLINGWRAWGPTLLPRLNGMFVFALFDADRQALFIARDRLGEKPLHYTRLADGSIAFASELKGLLANPAVRRQPSVQAVEDYFALGYVPDDACIVAGVKKLAAGSCLLLERGKPEPASVVWWDVDFTRRATGSARDLEEQMRGHLRDGVTSRMSSDVPLGAFLAGDVDSSTIVALMAEASPKAIDTCSIGFDSAARDETRYADIVAGRFATRHRNRIVAAEDFPAIDVLAEAFDEPFADPSAISALRLCQLARETVTVALSGEGADEVFAGYGRYRSQAIQERVRSVMSADLRRSIFGTLARYYPQADGAPERFRARSTFEALARDGDEAYARAVGVTGPAMRAALFSPGFEAVLQGHRAEDRIVAAMRNAPALDPLDRAQYADLKIWLPGDNLTKIDRTSMAASLEVRAPLLDHRLVEFGATLPVSMRLRGGTGKWLMKKAMRRYLPDDILYHQQAALVPPISAWFRGALAGEAKRITTTAFAETGWFDPVVLAKIGADHASGARDHGRLLWQLVMLEKSLIRVFGLHG